MPCFEITLNGKRLCLAGTEAGVLSAIVTWVGGAPRSPRKGGRTRAGEADLRVGGLQSPEAHVHVHTEWVQRRLREGDRVSIRLVQEGTPDPPRRRRVQTDDDVREQQRRYYLRVKKQFEKESKSPPPSPSKKTKHQPRGKGTPRRRR
jgi:hypothetical protein